MIRKANADDIPRIMEITRETVKYMNLEDNCQWDSTYPLESDFLNDISTDTLYVYEIKDEVVAFVCVSFEEAPEYSALPWNCKEGYMVVHRMAVSYKYRGNGIGSNLLDHAEKVARNNNASSLRTDTFCLNSAMNRLLLRHGYAKVGEVHFDEIPKPFYCYEKVLNNGQKEKTCK